MSSQRVNVDKLEIEMARILDRYGQMTSDAAKEVVKQTAEDTVAILKRESPKEYGNYAESWTYDKKQIEAGRWRHSTVVYNKKHYRLTHLLEYGHDLVTKSGKLIGRAKAKPHIRTAEEIATEEMRKNMIDKLSEVGFDL